jgi:hypothetical protein
MSIPRLIPTSSRQVLLLSSVAVAAAICSSREVLDRHADGSRPECHEDIARALNALLADTFALFVKTRNFHWHVSGPHFRDYQLLFDEL